MARNRSLWLLRVGEQHRLGRVVGHASGVEILDLPVHAVPLADAGEARPRIERLGVGARLPQIDAAGPAVLGINELLADEPWHRPKARRDLPEMLGAGVEVDTRWQAILDDCGNHGATLPRTLNHPPSPKARLKKKWLTSKHGTLRRLRIAIFNRIRQQTHGDGEDLLRLPRRCMYSGDLNTGCLPKLPVSSSKPSRWSSVLLRFEGVSGPMVLDLESEKGVDGSNRLGVVR